MTVRIVAVPWDDPRAAGLRLRQRAELRERYGDEDTEPGVAPSADDIAVFLLALADVGSVDASSSEAIGTTATSSEPHATEPLGCGGLRGVDDETGEIKRMYVAPAARGTGVATAILRALEDAARDLGWTRLVLETGDRQPDAIRFYEREGYTRIPAFGHYVGSEISLCFGRRL